MSEIQVNTINEYTSANGVTIDGLLIKDGAIPSIAGGKVLQVVQGTLSSAASSNSQTYADTGLTADITPSATSSKVLVILSHNLGSQAHSGALVLYWTWGTTFLDSPSTTSATTYKTQYKSGESADTVYVSTSGQTDTITLIEIGA
jgi:hypothetical protein